MSFSSKFFSVKSRRGFTLVEMMVVIGIVTIITSALLANLPRFQDRARLDLAAQEIAIAIRGAQVFGIGTKVTQTQTGGSFSSFGVYFCNDVDPSISELDCHKQFLLFSDGPDPALGNLRGNGYYIVDELGDQPIEVFNLEGAIKIASVRTSDSNDPPQVHLTFQRPDPDAQINCRKFDGECPGAQWAEIAIVSTKNGDSRYIRVYNTGFIEVSDQLKL